MMDCMPQLARSTCGLTGHAPRHALSEVAMAALCTCPSVIFWADGAPTQTEEGGPRVSQASSKHAMPNVYAAGNATLQREFDNRTKVVSVVRVFIAGRPWRNLVPAQRTGPLAFGFFLFGEADDISDFSESDDEVVHGENIVEGSAPAAEKRQRS